MNNAVYLSAADVCCICEALAYATEQVRSSAGDIGVWFAETKDVNNAHIQLCMAEESERIMKMLQAVNGTDHYLIDDDAQDAAQDIVQAYIDCNEDFLDADTHMHVLAAIKGLTAK